MRSRAAIVLLLAACSHGEPYGTQAPSPPNVPVIEFGMQRLSFGPEGDWAPAFQPDGSAFGFAWRLPNRDDNDRCLGVVPMSELRIATLICHGGRDSRDSTNAVFSQAFSAGGQVAYVQAEGRIQRMASARFLVVGAADGSGQFQNVFSFPRLMPDTQTYDGATHMGWVNENTIAFLATKIIYVTGVPEASDTAEVGIELARLDLAAAGATVTTVPNTRNAEALSVDPATGTAYALFNNVIHSVDLTTGQRTLAIDLTSLARVSDFTVSNGRIVAVVHVGSTHNSGELAVADLPGGTPVLLASPIQPFGPSTGFFFARPALAPSGSRIIAEGFTFTNHVISPGPARDTIVNHASDLYLITVP